jgi:hypothetical protein
MDDSSTSPRRSASCTCGRSATTIVNSAADCSSSLPAQAAGLPVRLEVASENDPSFRLYQRLGFAPIETFTFYMRLEWRSPATKS